MISERHVKEFCRPGQQERTCRYLSMHDGVWLCAKPTALRVVIDARVEEGDFTARGDNCVGWVEV